ncbi:myb-like protein U isoform X2 [Parasteatoda tepidariorum]|nr:mucin-5AC isoform X2 [Parasteatoda tepidariorum]
MCDWPRNVKSCESSGSGSVSSEESSGRRTYTKPTSKPSRSSYRNSDTIPSLNSIAPVRPTKDSRIGSRYTPPISLSESYAILVRNNSNFRPSMFRPSTYMTSRTTSSTRPYLYSTGPPASFKPVYYRVTSPNPQYSSTSGKRNQYDDDYYDNEYEDDESSLEEPHIMVNQHLRNGNNLYVRPVTVSTLRPSPSPKPSSSYTIKPYNANSMPSVKPPSSSNSAKPYSSSYNHQPPSSSNNAKPYSSSYNHQPPSSSNSAKPHSSSYNHQPPSSSNNAKPHSSSYNHQTPSPTRLVLNPPPNTRNTNSEVNYSSRDQPSAGGYPSQPRPFREDSRPSHTRNIRPAAPTHGSNVRTRTSNSNSVYNSKDRDTLNPRPQTGIQSLDGGGDSLDAQFGTNPRSISLPDRLNSFIDSDMRKAERNYNKPKVTSTRYSPPVERPAYKTETSLESYEEYPEYYYDDEEYDNEEDVQNISPVPKVVIRLQKPSSTTRRTTTTTTTTTTRRPTPKTTKRAATTKPPKRGLPFGISRPATKAPIRTGPKPLPRLPFRPDPVYQTPRALTVADKCNSRHCFLPDCRCASIDIPAKIPAREVPQIVLITFDDAVNDLNYELYGEIFNNRKNPNGCPILGTFYVSHEWTDYGMVQTLYSNGHEMASHSITHSHPEKFSVSHWSKEINGQREILHLYGGVKLEDIRGMRAPFLQVGGNNMFEMLYLNNFTYDSSMPVHENNPPFYPYTLDYNMGHECSIPPCPTKSFPGLWEVGMVMWNDYRGGRCSMGDACANPDNAEDVYKMLLKNFERHYNTNRAPFGLFYHAAWFTTQHYRKGYLKFIDYINSKDDVYMVTNWQAIQWMRDPTPLSKIHSFKPFQCPKDPDVPGPCHHPKSCNLNYKGGGTRNLKTCQPCPSTFPWTGRTGFEEVYIV